MQIKQMGFSLVEILLCFLLIAIASLGLVKLQVNMEQRADYAKHSIKALNLAEQKLEWFRTRGASAATSAMIIADFDSIATGSSISGAYSLQWQVPPATISGSLKTITVTSSWEDRMGQTQSVQLKTMISRYSEFDK
ncbi:type IV pilus modification PilV family protein [Vibrio natriegens]|uniref:type IV pilus modification PilV family protein n=1 Tax=Vibrio natriegens TaxID=691 RepID=UPI001FBBE05E|nr:type IV pilin [Vibrio natriegens]